MGIARAEIIVVRMLARKKKITTAASTPPSIRCSLTVSTAAWMNTRLVADDVDAVVLGGHLLQLGQPLLEQPGHLDGVRARLLADVQQHGRGVVERARLLISSAPSSTRPRSPIVIVCPPCVGDGDLLDLGDAVPRGPSSAGCTPAGPP